MDGYIRVSRRMGRKGPGYISVKVQRDAIQRWADYRSVEIAAWHIDEDESGGTQARPGLRQAMARIECGETGGLACWRLNRFARNVSDAIADVKRIHAAGAHLACIEEDIDPTGPFGTFILTVMLAVATLERDNAVAGFEEAKRRAVARGAYVSRTPFGYRRNQDGTLAPHQKNAPIVSEAFRLAASSGLHAAMDHLARTVPERSWTTTKVRRLLAGRSYLGETRNGDLFKADTHEALVSVAVWTAAQTDALRRRPADNFPLSGLLRCGSCGGPLSGGRGGTGQRTYRCMTRCGNGSAITARLIESYVRDHARGLLAGMRITVSDPEQDALTLLERAILDAEAELDAFAADVTLRRSLGDRYHVHLETRVGDVARARDEYRARAHAAQTRLTLATPDILDTGDPQLLSAVLRGIFDSVVIARGHLPVSERVRFFPVDRDRPSGKPSA